MTTTPELRARLMEFLVEESAAIDERRYDDWLAMLSDDFVYAVPVPTAREDLALPQYVEDQYLAHESKSFLQMRFSRTSSDFAWAERPAAFQRHLVGNLRVHAEENDGPHPSWVVATNVMVVRSRLPETPTVSSAGRRDIVVETAEGLRLGQRLVHLDVEVPTDSQLSIIY
ncbi:aromatic-ring-hydroxylating dioxygenase subunit beta [Nocardioides sp. LHG3406-4]|uniref:aromatic-ring-hydroxylating dioxygenase subunit beta n=1 Tax=Nocardioides sp. LHG3406-4 TaxID=2804575 RepID=UPI003CF80C85